MSILKSKQLVFEESIAWFEMVRGQGANKNMISKKDIRGYFISAGLDAEEADEFNSIFKDRKVGNFQNDQIEITALIDVLKQIVAM